MMHWDVLLHPKVYAEAINAHPPLGAATLLLVTWSALWALVMSAGDILLRRRYEGARKDGLGFLAAMAGVSLLLLVAWVGITFLTLGIARWIGHPLAFEALFCLLLIATVPKFLVWLLCPLREISPTALYGWRTLATVFLFYTAQRLWETLGAAGHLNAWQSLAVASPSLAALFGAGAWEVFAPPSGLQAAYPWRRAGGKRVAIFYPSGNGAADAAAMAQEADVLVAQIERILDVKPLPFRIRVFLFRHLDDMRRLKKTKDHLAIGYANADHVSLVYGPWRDIKATVAHELTHTVAMQRLNLHLMPLLNEGLAEYGEAQAVPESVRAAIRIPLSLGTLAHSGVFYDFLAVEEPDYSGGDKYAHAAALVDYLIGRYGMDKFKEFCRQTSYDSKQNQAAQLHKAVREIYGLSVRQLEQNWRQEWIDPSQIENP